MCVCLHRAGKSIIAFGGWELDNFPLAVYPKAVPQTSVTRKWFLHVSPKDMSCCGACPENTLSKLTWYRTKASFSVMTTLAKINSFKLYCWKKIKLLTPVFLSSSQPSFFQTQFFRAKMLGTDYCTVSYAVWCKEITRESDMFFLDSTADG